ncbi:hypothetical protein D3C72_2029800 [compost metagenome]
MKSVPPQPMPPETWKPLPLPVVASGGVAAGVVPVAPPPPPPEPPATLALVGAAGAAGAGTASTAEAGTV